MNRGDPSPALFARRDLLRGALAVAPASALSLLAGCASNLPRPDARITGKAFTRNRVYVQPDAVFEAVLMDVSNDNGPPVALARQRMEPAGQSPFELNIPFESGQLQRDGKYLVQAQVTLYNQLLFYTPGSHPVLPEPAFYRTDVILEPYPRTTATAAAGVAFSQTHWRLASVGELPGIAVAAPEKGAAPAFIQFHPQRANLPAGMERGEFSGSGGCNRFLGSYQVEGGALRLALNTTSIRLCLEGGKDEPAFLSALLEVRTFLQTGRELVMRDQEGKPILRFHADEAGEAAFEPYEPENSPQ
ncbi:YbaY family lipoprotein [Diaphorobacter aerolatus]|uniref:META domain-containing protein n=1 Tax=Diaphorobacter aerolatus TaxID=1288495 RepID=A0A7H0GH08_9BURK|nr:YbaY family lipoprotein [Diaphorobacter aerolatus]QNP47574.1 META domain-containing protein [Diaphorobacter aerolatus]